MQRAKAEKQATKGANCSDSHVFIAQQNDRFWINLSDLCHHINQGSNFSSPIMAGDS